MWQLKSTFNDLCLICLTGKVVLGIRSAGQTDAIDNSYDQASDCSQPGADKHQPQGHIHWGIAWAMVVIAITERQQPAEQETTDGSCHCA